MMLSKKPIKIYYFSGTGNTFLIAKKIKETFENENYEVDLNKITSYNPAELENDCHLGIVVPVAIQSTFPIVWDFIDKLPYGNKRKVFLADTMEIFSGGIVGPMKKILKSKGYICIGAHEFKMSSSMQKKEEKVETGKIKNESALNEAVEYAKNLLEGKTNWGRVPVMSDLMKSFSNSRKIWTKMSEGIKINDDICVRCRICEKHCPVGAMSLVDNHIKINHNQCIDCMRCVNYCPVDAFTVSGKNIIQKKVVKIDEL